MVALRKWKEANETNLIFYIIQLSKILSFQHMINTINYWDILYFFLLFETLYVIHLLSICTIHISCKSHTWLVATIRESTVVLQGDRLSTLKVWVSRGFIQRIHQDASHLIISGPSLVEWVQTNSVISQVEFILKGLKCSWEHVLHSEFSVIYDEELLKI